LWQRNCVVSVDDCKYRKLKRGRADELFADLESSGPKTVFAKKAVEDFVNELAGEGKFIQCPAFDLGMQRQRPRVIGAQSGINPTAPC
jgi:hypothetical protein